MARQGDFTAGAKLFHWLTAALIFVLFPLAWVMGDYFGVLKFQLYNWHKSLGITVLVLMIGRVVWRWLNPPPKLPEGTPRLERWAAHLGHLALYVLLFLQPLTGWAMISASPFPSRLFQVYSFPLIPWIANLPPEQKKPLEEALISAHAVLANLLLALIAIHILAALRHGLILRDGVMSRMFPRLLSRRVEPVHLALFVLCAAITVFGLSGRVFAAEWQVKPGQSKVGFEATGSGYTAKGTFPSYKSEIRFDPDTPDQAFVRLQLDMKSAATGTKDVDVTLQQPDYFDPGKFPTADFVAKGATKGANGQFVLQGQLTLKGVTKPVQVPFALSVNGNTATVKGETKVNRLDFGVGPETVAGLVIDKDVKITFDLTALKLDN
jgi:cytochrome b561